MALTQSDFENAFVLKLAGAADFRNEKEIWIEYGELNTKYSIEFPTNSPTYVIVRGFYDNGKVEWESERVSGLRHGKTIFYDNRGQITHEEVFKKGKMIRMERENE